VNKTIQNVQFISFAIRDSIYIYIFFRRYTDCGDFINTLQIKKAHINFEKLRTYTRDIISLLNKFWNIIRLARKKVRSLSYAQIIIYSLSHFASLLHAYDMPKEFK